MREEHRNIIAESLKGSPLGLRLLDHLFEQPVITVQLASQHMECAYVTANKLIEQFSKLGLLQELTGWKRNRRYRYEPYLALFEGDTPLARDQG
jgi:Fic family protein